MYEAFPSFEGECYYVRVTEHAPEEQDVAREAAAVEIGTAPENLELSSLWLREVEGDEAMEVSNGEFDLAWAECEQGAEDAHPFYKVVET